MPPRTCSTSARWREGRSKALASSRALAAAAASALETARIVLVRAGQRMRWKR
jgi:hypothetical protein